MTRLAIVLSVLGMSLCAASTAAAARSEFFGIVQGQLDDQDLQGMAAAGVRTERFELGWRSLEPSRGSYRWGRSDTFIGALASRGIRPLPFVWMIPAMGGRRPRAAPARPAAGHRRRGGSFLKAAVARYGPGGSYWATGYRQRYGANATPLPIQSWQIWNEPNLKKFFDPEGSDQAVGLEVRPAAADLPRRDQEPGSAGPDRPRRKPRLPAQRGPAGLGLPRRPLRACPGSRATSTPPPCTPIRTDIDGLRQPDPAVPRGDAKARRRRARRCGSPSSAGDRRLLTASASTRAPRAKQSGSPAPSG